MRSFSTVDELEKEYLNITLDDYLLLAESDEKAFYKLFRHYTVSLKPFLYGMSGSFDLTEEVIQETMLKVWLNREKFQHINNPRSWIFKVAANTCFNKLKRLQKAPVVSNGLAEIEEIGHNEVVESVDYKQLKKWVTEAINSLPAKRKKIYIMQREEGFSIAEIAEKLAISPNTVRNTLAAANESVREYLLRKGVQLNFVGIILFCFLQKGN